MKKLLTTAFLLSSMFISAQSVGYAKAVEMKLIDTTSYMSVALDSVSIIDLRDNKYYIENWVVVEPKDWKIKGSWDKKYFRKSM